MTAPEADLVHRCRGEAAQSSSWPSVIQVLAEHARSRGDAPFLTTLSQQGEETTLTYRAAEIASRRLAAWIRRELDVSLGTVLALIPTNDTGSVVAVLSVLRAGCGLLMLGPADPPDRHAEQVAALGARAVLRAPSAAVETPGSVVDLPHWAELTDDLPDGLAVEPGTDAFFFGTSGSTAKSKLVAQSHGNTIANAVALGRHHHLRPGDRVLGCLPIHHVNGLHFTVMGTLVAGAHTVLADSFSPFGYPALVRRFRPRIASVVPSVLEALVETWRAPGLPSDFDYFVSAAAPLTTQTARAVLSRLGARVVQGYGLSETTNFATTMPPHLSEDAYRRLTLDTDIPPVGVALHGNDVAVLDESGVSVPAGTVGEVCMRGLNVMSRYAGNPTATVEAFRAGWFHSHDLGFVHRDTETGHELLVLTGRMKNIAKVSGESVSLDEMDRVLRALPQVRDAACVAVADRFTGERVVAAVVLAPGAEPASLDDPLRKVFPPAVLPSRIVEVDAVPRTSTGKVLRPRLGSMLAAERDR